ncbi:Bug family tripartite tricarboxylate transporter substrate binding protein [Rhodoplanes sp. Z2-YC6860]|uniref:Bug family tripartite tricarboxylate transporter substrate binding protein n=1 Tax=Rhodoplanes sp. Z2-YC6860 TaxID=674703 RepID=UPI00078C968C|nr:tripartite tricarboxylate transporter substrate binding protein [Rhodoplanes sp. Z2-YC6860]AMN39899.1 ABC transporter substrate-binding protein [Rhodoplanes sp. Z2-YC6860]
MTTRRNFMALAGSAGLSAGFGQTAWSQSTIDGWPSRAVRVISPTATGGPGQNFRLYADNLKNTFGQSFVLENMPGASGSIGCMTVARSEADGHTLLLASNSHIVLAPLVISGSPVNVKRDFDPIALMFTFPFLLVVNPDLGVKTLDEFVAYAKARPGQLNWGSPGVGTGGHLVTELLLKKTGIKGQHVPYPGTTQQLLAAAAGTLQFTFDTPGNSKGLRDSGKVLALAVTGDKRSNTAPEVPTFKELGYDGFDDLRVANGLLAPKGTSPKLIQAFNAEIVKMNSSGAVHDTLVGASYEPGVMSPQDYGAMIDRELEQWGAIVRETGVQIKS